MDTKNLFSIKEAAKKIGCSDTILYAGVKSGRFKAKEVVVGVRKRRFFEKAEIDRIRKGL